MNRQSIVVILLLVLIGGVVAKIVISPDDTQSNAFSAREVAAWGLGQHLKETKVQRILIISNPFTKSSTTTPAVKEMEEAGIRGLARVFGTNQKIVYPKLKAGASENPRAFVSNPEITTPLSFLVDPAAFDQLASQN